LYIYIYIDFNGLLNDCDTFNNLYERFRIKIVIINNGLVTDFSGTLSTSLSHLNINILNSTTIRNDLRIGPGNAPDDVSIYNFVATTLRSGELLPSDNEILYMSLDSNKWLKWYKIRKPFRKPESTTDESDAFIINEGTPVTTNCLNSTLVYNIGDGSTDTVNGIYNQVNIADNYSSLVTTNITEFIEEEIR